MSAEETTKAEASATTKSDVSGVGVLNLSARQQSTVASAVTLLATLVILAALVGVVYLIGLFLRSFSNVILPLAVSAVVALVLEPYYNWWHVRLGGGRLERWRLDAVLALVAVFLSILLPIVGVLWFFGDLLVEQIADLVEKAPTWWAKVEIWFRDRQPRLLEYWENYGLQEKVTSAMSGKESTAIAFLRSLAAKSFQAGAGIFTGIGSLLNWFLVPIYVAFILMSAPSGDKNAWSRVALPFLKERTRDDIAYLVEEFVAIIVAFFRGQLLIAFLQGVLYAIGFTAIGLSYGWLLGLVLGLLNIIPYLGSIVGLGVAVPIAFFQQDGGLWTAGAVLAVFTIVQMIEGYLLTPKIMGEQTGLHPMAIMVAIFFWGTALHGIMGMLLAIPLTAFFVVFWRLVRERYIRELV